MSKTISVEYDKKPCYSIYLEETFVRLPQLLSDLGYSSKQKICIITDSNVAKLYLKEVKDLLQEKFNFCTDYVFEAGEASKNTDTVGRAYEHLIQNGFDRKDLLIALGGGVVGDLTGFTAATYLRGIDFVQVPTTLLSQVDSSIGGKTGVDFMQYKNMVGAFYMPKLVYMNLATLKTLPKEQYFSGMGEILKHGQIKNRDYYDRILAQKDAILNRELYAIEEMVYGSCLIKREVVQNDPKEQGERALLNFGHTIGHAIEKLSDFQLFHGECVALGMVSAAYLSCKFGTYKEADFESLKSDLKAFGLPVCLGDISFSADEVLKATKSDKKMEAGKIKFILLHQPGDAFITRDLMDEQILEGIQILFK